MSTGTEDDGPAFTRRQVAAPVRAFPTTESGSAGVLVLAIAAALAWSDIDLGSYETVWRTRLALSVGGHEVARDLRTWVRAG